MQTMCLMKSLISTALCRASRGNPDWAGRGCDWGRQERVDKVALSDTFFSRARFEDSGKYSTVVLVD